MKKKKVKRIVLVGTVLFMALLAHLMFSWPYQHSEALAVYEDFMNDYTKIDPNVRFSFATENHIEVENLNRAEDAYIYKDFGVDHFGDFIHDVDVRGRDTGGTSGNDLMSVWMLSNAVDDIKGLMDTGEIIIRAGLYEFDESDPDSPTITLQEYDSTNRHFDAFEGASRDTWYYLRITKRGIDLKCGIYTTAVKRDAGDGTDGDVANLGLTLQADHKFRYVFGVNSHNAGSAHRKISGDIKNLNLNEARALSWISVDPLYYNAVNVGETFQASINVSTRGYEGHGMFGYTFKFYWNRTLINATGVTITRPAAWGSNWIDIGRGLIWDYNATHGRYDTATTASSPATEVYGNFTLVTIDFEAIYKPVPPEPDGRCLLNLVDTALGGEDGFLIPHDTYDGEYEIIEHDVSITDIHGVSPNNFSVQINKTVLSKNYSTCINVTVANEGHSTEITNVALWAQNISTYQIGGDISVTLAAGASKEVTFLFNSTNLPKRNYKIFANATIVSGETDVADNTYLDGLIRVAHPGDIDCNGHVYLNDLAILENAWNTRPSDLNWNPNADIDGDCHVFLYDLTVIGTHWNEHS